MIAACLSRVLVFLHCASAMNISGYAEEAGTRKVRAFSKRTILSDVSCGMNVWMKVFSYIS
ncbi:MAG: hypothetical protein CO187_05365 [Zetaproteobacteria bacterium CG_4_9_14_3_um_filter_53_7]|nr:MAG: hypothetical protein CO187_05365 [Zetaproteobacteria bacterium CG_4_9_14_3_um_filter_53_7]